MKTKLFSGLLASASMLTMFANTATSVSASTTTSTDNSASVDIKGGSYSISEDDTGTLLTPSFKYDKQMIDGKAHMGIRPSTFENVANTSDKYTGSRLGITDNRGTATGWHVDVSLGKFVDEDKHELKGATLTFKNIGVSGEGLSSLNVIASSETTATQDGTTGTLASASKGNGMGSYTIDLKNTELNIPTTEYAGSYVAPITYTLLDGPASQA